MRPQLENDVLSEFMEAEWARAVSKLAEILILLCKPKSSLPEPQEEESNKHKRLN